MFKNIMLFICLVASNIVMGQKSPVLIGLKAGTYFSRYKFDNLPSQYRKPDGDDNVYFGISTHIPVSKHISIMPEVLYAMSSDNSYIQNIGLSTDEFSHLQVPVLLKYNIGKLGICAGPQAYFLLKAKGNYYSSTTQYDPISNTYYNTIESGDIKNNSYRKFGFSGLVGLEYVFKYRFGIDARYERGITDFRASNGATVMTKYGSIHNHAFQTGLFFRFGKKPKSS